MLLYFVWLALIGLVSPRLAAFWAWKGLGSQAEVGQLTSDVRMRLL